MREICFKEKLPCDLLVSRFSIAPWVLRVLDCEKILLVTEVITKVMTSKYNLRISCKPCIFDFRSWSGTCRVGLARQTWITRTRTQRTMSSWGPQRRRWSRRAELRVPHGSRCSCRLKLVTRNPRYMPKTRSKSCIDLAFPCNCATLRLMREVSLTLQAVTSAMSRDALSKSEEVYRVRLKIFGCSAN